MLRFSLKKITSAACTVVLSAALFAQTKPLYQLPENLPDKNAKDIFLTGTDTGLFKVLQNGNAEPLWTGGRVERILRTAGGWYFVTEKGILYSKNLIEFESRNNGLPFLTIKNYEGGIKSLEQQAPLLKDICADPFNPEILVTATKDNVYLSTDAGLNWKSLGSCSTTSGIKAVAVSYMPVYDAQGKVSDRELVAFMAHSIKGFSYYKINAKNPAWIDCSAGFAAMPSLTQPDEISDILPVAVVSPDVGSVYSELYISNTYLPNIYRFDWRNKKAVKVYQGKQQIETIDGLCQSDGKIIFTALSGIKYYSLLENKVRDLENFEKWRKKLDSALSIANAAYVPASVTGLSTPLSLSELWMLKSDFPLTPWGETANHKKAVYVSAYQMRNMDGIQKYKKIIKDNRLNALVVDMKDDYGLLRFEPKSELLKEKGTVTQYKIDVDKFVSEYKKDDIYLIARIVVFKDKNLSLYDKKQYAVWDSSAKKPWLGIKGTEKEVDENGKETGKTNTLYYDENWVDPFCEEVWEYNVEIARELVARGFDEIQFDYIRFPTDGTNLKRAQFRWQDKGMDKESALLSFLKYARKNINAPIGIDIYGANGWYRSGTRTGQDVELMSEYVDVICPMFYPSHFEQDFLEYTPVEERPYRIYFFGSYRNTVMGRNHIVVRPWVQAFYMGVRYDRNYYNKDYVKREIFGCRDGLDRGYMYWNNSGKFYEDISPDPLDTEVSPWHAAESDLQKPLPAFSSGRKNVEYENTLPSEEERKKDADMISILDTVLNQNEESPALYSVQFLKIEPFGVGQH